MLVGSIHSQVFVSQTIKDHILLGPENVSFQRKATAIHYFSKINAFQPKLEEKKAGVQKDIEDLKNSGNPNKKSFKKKMKRFQSALDGIEKEQTMVTLLSDAWIKTMKYSETMLELSGLQKRNECFEVMTSLGKYTSEQLVVDRIEISNPEIDAFIPISNLRETGSYVKCKKSPNCFSVNEEDCYVMCYKKTISAYSIKDMEGKTVELKNAPLNMEYNKRTKTCVMKKQKVGKVSRLLILKSKETDEILDVANWSKIDCAAN